MDTNIIKYYFLLFTFLLCIKVNTYANTIYVGKGKAFTQIKQAVNASKNGDTIVVEGGIYKEGNIIISKSIVLSGKDYPILDGELKYEIISIKK